MEPETDKERPTDEMARTAEFLGAKKRLDPTNRSGGLLDTSEMQQSLRSGSIQRYQRATNDFSMLGTNSKEIKTSIMKR